MTKRQKLTPEQKEKNRIERLRPVAEDLWQYLQHHSGEHEDQESLAAHFGWTVKYLAEIMLVVLDHVVPKGHWIEPNPYRVVTRTPSRNFGSKKGYFTKTIKGLERTSKSMQLVDNPTSLLNVGMAGEHAAQMVKALQNSATGALDAIRAAEARDELIVNLKAQLAEADAELARLSDDD